MEAIPEILSALGGTAAAGAGAAGAGAAEAAGAGAAGLGSAAEAGSSLPMFTAMSEPVAAGGAGLGQDIGFGAGNLAPGFGGITLPEGASLGDTTSPGSAPFTGGGDTPGTGKPMTQKLADALKELGNATKEEHNQGPPASRLDLSPRTAQSQAVQGRDGLNSLLQLLMQQRGAYGPPGVGGGGGRGGLLGM
jgi:hypothetical protein